VLRSGPYRVYFYSHESNEPATLNSFRSCLKVIDTFRVVQVLVVARKFVE